MDLDKPLDALIADKRKSEPRRSTGSAPRRSTGRDGPTPYAVSLPLSSKRITLFNNAQLILYLKRPPPRSTEDKWVHDAYSGPGANRAPRGAGVAVAGTGVGFTGVSPKIEVIGLHYEVTPADLKVCHYDVMLNVNVNGRY